MKFVNVGFNNMIATERIVALVGPESAPAKRLIQDAKESGRAIDCTSGRKTRSVIVTDSEHVILCAVETDTIAQRISGETTEREAQDE